MRIECFIKNKRKHMYPTISYFLEDLLGINIPLPIQTFGFLLFCRLLAGYFISKEFKERKKVCLSKSSKKTNR